MLDFDSLIDVVSQDSLLSLKSTEFCVFLLSPEIYAQKNNPGTSGAANGKQFQVISNSIDSKYQNWRLD